MSEDQINALARAVAREILAQQPQHSCLFNPEDISTLKRFCRRAEAAEKAAIAALTKVIVVGGVSAFVLGFLAWLKSKIMP
jgi:hypothetical protein